MVKMNNDECPHSDFDLQVRRHTRDLGLLAHGVRGSQSRGSLCYLIEDSWPMYESHQLIFIIELYELWKSY